MRTSLSAVAVPLTETDSVTQADKSNKKSPVEFNDFRNKLQGNVSTTKPQSLL
jgi:hypothetical protein